MLKIMGDSAYGYAGMMDDGMLVCWILDSGVLVFWSSGLLVGVSGGICAG